MKRKPQWLQAYELVKRAGRRGTTNRDLMKAGIMYPWKRLREAEEKGRRVTWGQRSVAGMRPITCYHA